MEKILSLSFAVLLVIVGACATSSNDQANCDPADPFYDPANCGSGPAGGGGTQSCGAGCTFTSDCYSVCSGSGPWSCQRVAGKTYSICVP